MKLVVFNPVAVTDLDEITDYIAADNPDAAARVRKAVYDTAGLLSKFPSLGCRPAFKSACFKGIRFIPVKQYRNYLIFYRESEREVEILRVLHGNRDTPKFFSE